MNMVNKPTKHIFIPTDYNGNVLGVFFAFSREVVDAFLLGRNQSAHKMEIIDMYDDFTYNLPLVTLLTSNQQKGYNLKDSESYNFLKRGV